MSKLTLHCNLPKAAALMAVVLVSFALLRADDKRPSAAQPQLAKDLIGTWVLVGTPDKVGTPPAAGGRLKLLTGNHWAVTEADPNSGKVVFHHGGTYTIDGDIYTETVTYANENTADLIGQKFQFNVKVVGDVFTNLGKGNPWNEAWKRVVAHKDVKLKNTQALPKGISKITKEQLIAKVPSFFYFDYPYEPQPGKRLWMRIDDNNWIERYPDGTQSKFQILGRTIAGRESGTVVVKIAGDPEKTFTDNDGGFQVFIPDKGNKEMAILFRYGQGDSDWKEMSWSEQKKTLIQKVE
jgi:hypothetical protein